MTKLTMTQNFSLVIARILFVAIFCFQDAIYNKIIYASRSIQYMINFGLPYPHVLLVLTIIVELISGFMIITGRYSRLGALFIFCFTLGATIIFHRFWTYSDPAEFQNQLNHFMKNISIMGGAIFIMVFGVGKFKL